MNVIDKYFIYPAKPTYIPPTSTLFGKLDNDLNYVAEVKKNGWRCLVRKIDGKITLWTRHKTTINDALPTLRKELTILKIPDDSILDGELLEHRSVAKDSLMLWGIYRWAGNWYDKVSYYHTRDTLSLLLQPQISTIIFQPKSTLLNKRDFYERILKEDVDNEGIVLKKLDAPVPFFWNSSKEITTWLKVKERS